MRMERNLAFVKNNVLESPDEGKWLKEVLVSLEVEEASGNTEEKVIKI